jgi:predicted DCC family thiol-disulfide oxidoreductase YuxK
MKIYYDNKCKICNKEIKFYKKFGVKNIEWIGIHNKDLSLKNEMKEKLLKKFHVVDDLGNTKIGVDAFIALWKKHGYFKYLAYIANIFFIKITLNLIYNIFAKYRYEKKYKSNE